MAQHTTKVPPSERPPCRCVERQEALARAGVAYRNGDMENWRVEMAFVNQTMLDDAKLFAQWQLERLQSGLRF